MLTEQLLAYAPESEVLQNLAKEYHADKDRFAKEPSFCILCGLCVRYCAEIKQKNVIGFVDRGPTRAINFIPEVATRECWDCKECFPLCPTSALQAAYVLMKSLAPVSSSERECEKPAQTNSDTELNQNNTSFAVNSGNTTPLQANAKG